MRAAAIDRFGPPSVVRVRTLPVPALGPGEVLIALAAAGVGIWDVKIRDGSWAEGDETFPLILGTDGAGTVAAVGARVRRLRVGARVWAYRYANPKGGFHAEYVAVDAKHVAPAPRRLSLLEAGAAAVTGLTALQGIDDILKIRAGESLLIFGASGAVGTLAVQFARWRKARVLAAASGRDGVAQVRRLGADEAFDGRRELDRLATLAPGGIDAALVLAPSPALDGLLAHVRPGGRIAYPNGVEPPPRRRPRVQVRAYDAEVGPRPFARLDRAVTGARLRVPIAAAFPLEQAARAHARVGKGHVLGRVVIRIR
jgi:NADPH:quinone reductase-like Zn-dependent oxidoreductase